MKRREWVFSIARAFPCAGGAIAACLITIASAGAAVITDNFGVAADYSGGAASGIWSATVNMPNLNGGRFNTTANPGTLTVDDNGTADPDGDGDPTTGPKGIGWEPGRSTAPVLFAAVPAGQDFTATVKITAQTAGQWSAAGIIARATSPTVPGLGTDNADENFVTNFSFRTTATDTNQGTTDNKMVMLGAAAGSNDNSIAINLDPTDEPLPLWLKLERVNNTVYRSWVSTDGVNYQFQSRNTPTAGNALRDPAVALQLGLSYMNFSGTITTDPGPPPITAPFSGTAQFDDFSLDTHDKIPAPAALIISAPITAISVAPGTNVNMLVNNTTPGQGPLAWVRSINQPGTDSMNLSQGGPFVTTSPPIDPANGSYFRWDTTGRAPGVYTEVITATNDWGMVSNGVNLTITITPEPASAVLIGLAIAGLFGFSRRRR